MPFVSLAELASMAREMAGKRTFAKLFTTELSKDEFESNSQYHFFVELMAAIKAKNLSLEKESDRITILIRPDFAEKSGAGLIKVFFQGLSPKSSFARAIQIGLEKVFAVGWQPNLSGGGGKLVKILELLFNSGGQLIVDDYSKDRLATAGLEPDSLFKPEYLNERTVRVSAKDSVYRGREAYTLNFNL